MFRLEKKVAFLMSIFATRPCRTATHTLSTAAGKFLYLSTEPREVFAALQFRWTVP